MQKIHLGNDDSAHSCDLRIDKLSQALIDALKGYGLPVFSAMESKPVRIGVARIEAIPEIISTNSRAIECTSWVSLTLQSDNTLIVPPIKTPRNVVVTYWRGGMLVSSGVASHQQVITDTFDKLGGRLAQQFRMDQPPPLPSFDEPKE